MILARALGSGLIGAGALNLLHETARRVIPGAPQMQIIAMRALARAFYATDQLPPRRDKLYWLAMAGDLISNSLYYSLVALASRRHAWTAGVILGTLAGTGAVFLPRRIGLGDQPGGSRPERQVMTFAWYFVGGLVAAAVSRQLSDEDRARHSDAGQGGDGRYSAEPTYSITARDGRLEVRRPT